ncbi:MAG: DedA family protein [Gemmatimonadota bacterium]|nr:DedA family protein [Gemmatimonadota bacterium]MDH3427036.1 DedA family protein [Gemmatimonadota bacterium]
MVTQDGSGRNAVRRLYDWVLGWADRRGGVWALFGISFAEASFFPIPPDVLLIPLALGRPRRAFWFALVCTAGSVLGAIGGYLIGSLLFASIGQPILELYGAVDQYDELGRMYNDNLVLTLGTAGFTPIPFKVFTIAAGAFGVAFLPFVIISALSRSGRFFLVAGLIRVFGEPIRGFIERWFNLLSILFVVLLVGGFLAIRFLFAGP